MKNEIVVLLPDTVYSDDIGDKYCCIASNPFNKSAILQNENSNWKFTAYGIKVDDKNIISWGYSTNYKYSKG